jgi:hypothetical protein
VDAPVARYDSAAAVTAETTPANFKGKAVVVTFTPRRLRRIQPRPRTSGGPRSAGRTEKLAARHPAAIAPANGENTPAAIIAVVPDDQKEQWERVAVQFPRGTYALDPDGTAEQRTPTRGCRCSTSSNPRLPASIWRTRA